MPPCSSPYSRHIDCRTGAWGYAFGALAAGGIGLVLSLAEGDAGTLLRHRAVAIILLIPLAAATVGEVTRRLTPRSARG